MSFFSNKQNIGPGAINGSPLAGLCDRVAISVERVLDCCMKQVVSDCVPLELRKFSRKPTQPCTFVSASSPPEAETILSNLTIDRIAERTDFARVRCGCTVPVRVTLRDADKKTVTAESEVKHQLDVIMYIPPASVFPFEIKAEACCTCTGGCVENEHQCIASICTTLILKVTAKCDLLVPTYGFAPVPKAIDFKENHCSDFFELPLYPSGRKKCN
jgi:hypothetical protein